MKNHITSNIKKKNKWTLDCFFPINELIELIKASKHRVSKRQLASHFHKGEEDRRENTGEVYWQKIFTFSYLF